MGRARVTAIDFKEYYRWLCNLVSSKEYFEKSKYKNLLGYLYETQFTYIHPMDSNRYDDGLSLRYRFDYNQRSDTTSAELYLKDKPCSVLEMMAALALRCEEAIMGDPEYGDRTSRWFSEMLEEMGLLEYTDDRYYEHGVEKKVSIMLNREYSANGSGGLFFVSDPPKDMREVEIWYQLNWYLNELPENLKG